ncbi:MAG: hypothetical protein M1368_12445 [Thaumarchaeota archaeon]|nr:hypothetical protein [Nitrososphaerota archaeon]
MAPRLVPRWVSAGLALEEQARINEGTHNPKEIYSRITYPIGLKAITTTEVSESLNVQTINRGLFGKLIQSLGFRSSANTGVRSKESE